MSGNLIKIILLFLLAFSVPVFAQYIQQCDINQDGVIDITDITVIANAIETQDREYDNNNDGIIDNNDVTNCEAVLHAAVEKPLPIPPPVCSDSDGGPNIFDKGTTKNSDTALEDYCKKNNLFEHFCESDVIKSSKIKCPYGCNDGACKSNLIIESKPSRSDVYFDGNLVGKTPKTIKNIDYGNHQIRLVKEGFDDFLSSYHVDISQKSKIKIFLNKEPSVTITSKEKKAEIYLNDNLIGETKFKSSPWIGKKKLVFAKEGFESIELSHFLEQDQSASIYFDLVASNSANINSPKIKISSSPNKADVMIDGQIAGKTNKNFDVTPGLKTISISKPGYTPHNFAVDISNGEFVRYSINLLPINGTSIKVKSKPKKSLFSLNNDLIGKTTITAFNLVRDNFKFLVQNDNFRSYKNTLQIQNNQQIELQTWLMKSYQDIYRCHDSENDANMFEIGIVAGADINGNLFSQKDHCDGSTLIEYFCHNNEMANEVITCENGCKFGACIESSDRECFLDNDCPQPVCNANECPKNICVAGRCKFDNTQCFDTDKGLNYETEGACFNDGNGLFDICDNSKSNKGVLKESFCSENKCARTQYVCPEGQVCRGSKCILGDNSTPFCADSDGGLNQNLKGVTSGKSVLNVEDRCFLANPDNEVLGFSMPSCINNIPGYENYECGVSEFWCTHDDKRANAFIPCAFGCKDGACLPRKVAETCNFGEDLPCEGNAFACSDTKQIILKLRNELGYDIKLVKADVIETDKCKVNTDKTNFTKAVLNGKTMDIVIQCFDFAEDPLHVNIKLNYAKLGSNEVGVRVGKIISNQKQCNNIVCPDIYQPACGIDNRTYNNRCEAGNVAIVCDSTCPCFVDWFRNAEWECSDGSIVEQGGPASCKPSTIWSSLAQDNCKDNCNNASKCSVNSFSLSNLCLQN